MCIKVTLVLNEINTSDSTRLYRSQTTSGSEGVSSVIKKGRLRWFGSTECKDDTIGSTSVQ